MITKVTLVAMPFSVRAWLFPFAPGILVQQGKQFGCRFWGGDTAGYDLTILNLPSIQSPVVVHIYAERCAFERKTSE